MRALILLISSAITVIALMHPLYTLAVTLGLAAGTAVWVRWEERVRLPRMRVVAKDWGN